MAMSICESLQSTALAGLGIRPRTGRCLYVTLRQS